MVTTEQVSEIIMLRGLGFSQQEISDSIDMSRQSVAYQLKKLKKEAVLYGATNIFSKKTGMIKPDSRDLEDALLTVEILLDEDESDEMVIEQENVRQTILSFLGKRESTTLPEIHFYLARTFLGFDGSPAQWKKGWPKTLSSRLGWSKSLSDEIMGICGDHLEFQGIGKKTVTKARLLERPKIFQTTESTK